MGHLTVSLLGSLSIRLDDQPVTHLAKGKARALLAYLVVEGDRPHRRETLAGLLWPGWTERSARTNLRNALSNLRAVVGDRTRSGDRDAMPLHLTITRETIQFNRASDCRVDVWAFSERAKESWPTGHRLEEAVALYRGPFLEGFSGGDSPAFDDWALGVREQLAHLFSTALQALAKQYEHRGEHERACEVARQRVAHAPWQEQAHCELMRLLALSGQRGAALAQYEACRRALRDEIDVEPGEGTRRLYERIRDGELVPRTREDVGAIPVSRQTQAPPVSPSGQQIVPTPPAQPFPPPLEGIAQAPGSEAEREQGGLESERRVVTAMFAGIKGSTALTEQIDTEDWVEIMRGALQVLGAEIHRYGGEIDRYEGDGLVAFFGLSTVHEDDAERAVLAALAMQEAIERYAEELATQQGIELLLRVGLSTGEVITTHVGEARQHGEATAMGRTIALAARLRPVAEPGTVLVCEDTYHLVERSFEWQPIGPVAAKGYSEPVAAYRPLKHRGLPGKGRGIAGLESPLVGRDAELCTLQEALERLQSGIGGIVTVVGEAGIGKSRLVAEVRSRVAASSETSLRWVEGRCLSYATNTAYQVWLDIVRELLGVAPDAPPAAVREALQEWVGASCPDCYEGVYPYMARLLSLDERTEATLRGLGAEGLKASTFRAVETLVERAAGRRPLVLACEDLHWADPTSLELLQQLLPLTDRVPLLILCAFRPERSHGCWRVVETAARDYPHCHTDLRLGPLLAAESEVLVSNLLSLSYARDTMRHVEDLPEQLRRGILDHAEGNPFFVEEILRSLIDAGIIVRDEEAGQWYVMRDVSDIPIPDTLHGALSARIDRLEPEPKRVLQLASVIGRTFTYPILSALYSPLPSRRGEPTAFGRRDGGEPTLAASLLAHLLTLERAQLVRERARVPEREYIFKHHLTQAAAYSSLLKRQRRAYHRQVAEALERLYPERIEERVELLAHHWDKAGDAEKAILYLHQAGDKAVQQSAYQEGRVHLTKALSLLKTLPDRGPTRRLAHAQRELAMQSSLGMAWHAAKGVAPEALNAYTRARELGRHIGDISQSCRAVIELAVLHWVGGEHQKARELAEEALSLAQQANDPLLVGMSRVPLGLVLFTLGEYALAQYHLDQMIAFYRPDEHHGPLVSIRGSDLGLSALAYAACCLWCRGYPDQAVQRSQEALALARELGHPFSLADVLCYAGCSLTEMGRDWQALKGHTDELIRLADEKGMTWLLEGSLFRGKALSMLGQVQEGMALIREAIAESQSTGRRAWLPGYYRFLAEAQAQAEQPGEGLATLAEALTLVEETGERHWETELYRLRAELLLMQGDAAGAEASLHKAIEVARRQHARSWELRATTSLARLWREQGRAEEAREMLAAIYGWFSEGFGSADLVEARTLLEELAS